MLLTTKDSVPIIGCAAVQLYILPQRWPTHHTFVETSILTIGWRRHRGVVTSSLSLTIVQSGGTGALALQLRNPCCNATAGFRTFLSTLVEEPWMAGDPSAAFSREGPGAIYRLIGLCVILADTSGLEWSNCLCPESYEILVLLWGTSDSHKTTAADSVPWLTKLHKSLTTGWDAADNKGTQRANETLAWSLRSAWHATTGWPAFDHPSSEGCVDALWAEH